MIQETQPLITKEMAVYKYVKGMEVQYKRSSRFNEPINLYKIVGEYIHLPRGLCPVGMEDKRVEGVPIEVESNIVPRNDDQVRVIAELIQMFEADQSGMLEATTGSGKTVMMLAAICHMALKTLVIVPDTDLMGQWRKEIIKHTSIEASEIGRIQQNVCSVVGKKIVLGTIQSVCKDRYPAYIYQDFGIAVWDECHRANAETFCRSIEVVPAKLRVGMSATTDRRDGKEIIFTSHIGPVRVRSTLEQIIPNIIAVRTGWQIPRWPNGKPMQVKPGKSMHIFVEMARHRGRNELIVSYLKIAHEKGRKIIMLSALGIEKHLGKIRKLLIEVGVPATDIAYYVGGMSEKELDQSIGKPIVLGTYSMCGEGTDVPWWDFLLMATPRAHVKQSVGRIRREYPGKSTPIVVDMVDSASNVLFKFYISRKKWYKSIGCLIKEKF